MKCSDWEKVKLRRQFRNPTNIPEPRKIIGFDSETTKSGNPYLIMDSDGNYIFNLAGINAVEALDFLTAPAYAKTLNVWYNMQYDINAVIKGLPRDKLIDLWRFGEIEYNGMNIKMIPKKYFRIKRNNRNHAFFDIAQFYNMSLDSAAQTYLGKHKIKINLADYEHESKDNLIAYCQRDAELARDLTAYFISMINNIGIYTNKLYSTAYLSLKYFIEHCDIPVLRYKSKWAEYAFESYSGGRFEVFQRGYIDKVYVADINSAYPYEISRLADLRRGYWKFKKDYDKNAYYAFVKCKFYNDKDYSPIPYGAGAIKIYPRGDYGIVYLTKAEFELAERMRYDIEFIDGYFWYPLMLEYPFACIEDLYKTRMDLKKSGDNMEHCIKIILNSLYGKFIQLTPDFVEGTQSDFDYADSELNLYKRIYQTGNLFNPVYAALITSNTRLKIFNAYHGKKLIGYATDSVIAAEPFSVSVSDNLGDWKYETVGDSNGVFIGSGVYSVANKTKFRGFDKQNSKYDLISIMQQNPTAKIIKIPVVKPITLGEALNHTRLYQLTDICRFRVVDKSLDINFDTKRHWEREFINCADALKNAIESRPLDL